MMRSLYSAVSGLRNHQTAMDVIGNNIANVNTVGYKKSTVNFSTIISQTLQSASSPDSATTPAYGGTNPNQVGLGMSIGSISKLMTQGAYQTTGNPTDMMIKGSDFFCVQMSDGTTKYTRAGNFVFDGDGNLVQEGTGALVLGYKSTAGAFTTPPTTVAAPININTYTPPTTNLPTGANSAELIGYSIDDQGIITGIFLSDNNVEFTEQMFAISLATFTNPGGLESIGDNLYAQTNNSGTANTGMAKTGAHGSIITSTLEMSNVELAQEFTDMIVTQRGFQANSRVITVSDTLLEELINLKR